MEDDLALELDAELLARAAPRLDHQREAVGSLVAPPAFSMKFACFGEIIAPPMRWPLRPQRSSSCPAPDSPGGFLKTLPNVRLFVGCVAFRRATRSATVALISAGGRGSRRYSTRATTCPAAARSGGTRARAPRA